MGSKRSEWGSRRKVGVAEEKWARSKRNVGEVSETVGEVEEEDY